MACLRLYRHSGNDGLIQCDHPNPSLTCMLHTVHQPVLYIFPNAHTNFIQDLANVFEKPLASTLWANTVYLLFGATSQLYFTMMSEVFNHGPLWIIAVVFATIGTGICSGSMTLVELIIGRMIQGIGGGGAMSLCFVIMTESAPESIHSRYSCYILLTRMCGAILGPVVGGLFVDYADWRWAFYFNLIFCALGLLAIPFAVDLRVSKHIPLRKVRILDWSGVSLAFLGVGAMLVGVSWGGSTYRWSEWQTVVPIAVGGAVLLALVLYEANWALHPQFGRKVFRSRMMAMTHVGCFLHGFVVSGLSLSSKLV
jgi:MFS family permease